MIRETAVLTICAALLGCRDAAPSEPAEGAKPIWTMVWHDDFDGPSSAQPDTLRWSYEIADGCPVGICGFQGREKQYYTRAAANGGLNGLGQLAIVARVDESGLACADGPCRYTSAKLTTRGKLNASPGRVEARIRIPAGQGLWPAFKLVGSSFPGTSWPQCGELDIMENRGSDPRTMSSSMHGPGYSYLGQRYTLEGGGTLADDYHEFAIEWDRERVSFFVDGTRHYTFTRADVERFGPWPFDQSFFIVLSLAVGGVFDGDPKSDAIFPAEMLIDYVRVYVRS